MAEEADIFVTLRGASPQKVKVKIKDDCLLLQLQCFQNTNCDSQDGANLAKERVVSLPRERVGGLGLSVKGGAEHNLPVLISRIFKDQAADKTGQLFVGDAIIKVNDTVVENFTHDQAVQCLKNAGENVLLTVKYFRPASLFLNRNSRVDDSKPEAIAKETGSRRWTDAHSVSLVHAWLDAELDRVFSNGAFDLVGPDGQWSASFHGAGAEGLHPTLRDAIDSCSKKAISQANQLLIASQQVVCACWVLERVMTRGAPSWQRQFVALKGDSVCLLNSAPDGDLQQSKENCFFLQTGGGDTRCLATSSPESLVRLQRAWYRANYLALTNLQRSVFRCSWRQQPSELVLDFKTGFSLWDLESKQCAWTHRFSQLRSSSDDGNSRLCLHFLPSTENSQQLTREVETLALQTLLFTIHAFFSAKLAAVDPTFLNNA